MGHLRKLGTKTHFAKLTHILSLKKAWGCRYKGLFLLSPSPPSSVDCVELKLEYITSTLHRRGRGKGRCLNLTSYCVSVPRRFDQGCSFTPERNPYRIGLLFRHKNSDFSATSVTERSCTALISKMEHHILDKFGAIFKYSVNRYWDRTASE